MIRKEREKGNGKGGRVRRESRVTSYFFLGSSQEKKENHPQASVEEKGDGRERERKSVASNPPEEGEDMRGG